VGQGLRPPMPDALPQPHALHLSVRRLKTLPLLDIGDAGDARGVIPRMRPVSEQGRRKGQLCCRATQADMHTKGDILVRATGSCVDEAAVRSTANDLCSHPLAGNSYHQLLSSKKSDQRCRWSYSLPCLLNNLHFGKYDFNGDIVK
jgi:hypothetical protein